VLGLVANSKVGKTKIALKDCPKGLLMLNLSKPVLIKYIAFGLTLLAAGGYLAYDLMINRPVRECEAKGKWWSPEDRTCVSPIILTPSKKPSVKAS